MVLFEAKTNLILLDEFTSAAKRIFKLFGIKMTKNSNESSKVEKVWGIVAVFCVLLIVSQAIAFIVTNFGEDGFFLALTFNISCVGFAWLSVLKVYMIGFVKHEVIVEVFEIFDLLFPKTNHGQKKYKVKKYLDHLKVENWTYSILLLILFSYFNFTEILISLFKFFWVDGSYDKNFPFFLWFPFLSDGKIPIVFEVFFVLANCCGFTCVFINLAADLLYCSLVTVLCMEFEILRKKFEEFDKLKTRKDLAALVAEHCQLIR